MSRLRVLVAPDKFKGSLAADAVAAAIAAGVRAERADAAVTVLPIADGGDGTLLVAGAAGFTRVEVMASDALGRRRPTSYARRGDDALVELAEICGLATVHEGDELTPLTATTRGVGEVVAAALDAGCRRIIVGLGGSASTDGGAGLLVGLGARVLDGAGAPVPEGGAGLAAVASLDLRGLHPGLRSVELVAAADVDNPLTGPRGAARVYAPQKGADERDVEVLETALGHWADIVAVATGADRRQEAGTGAAGGAAFALTAVLGASHESGADVVFDLIGLRHHLESADLVVTGEGRVDAQTLQGKGPGAVAALARDRRVPTVIVAGSVDLDLRDLGRAGVTATYSLVDLVGADRSWHDTARSLEEVGRRLAREQLGPA